MPKQLKLLFIDDDRIGQALNEAIVQFHYDDLCKEFSLNSLEIVFAENIKEAEAKLSESIKSGNFVNGILSDIQLIEATGFDFLQLYYDKYLEDYPKTVVALITAFISDTDIENFKKFPYALKIFERPLDAEKMKIFLSEIFKRYS